MKHNEKPLSDEHRPTPGKKNTKRWCKGKIGREHVRSVRSTTRFSREYTCGVVPVGSALHWGLSPDWRCYHEEYCTACGKITRWQISKEECPTFQLNPASQWGIKLSSSSAPY